MFRGELTPVAVAHTRVRKGRKTVTQYKIALRRTHNINVKSDKSQSISQIAAVVMCRLLARLELLINDTQDR